MATRPDSADLLARAALEINSHGDLPSTLEAVVACLQTCLPTPHHVGVSLVRRGETVGSRAASDDLAAELDDLQHTLSDGPCCQALREEPVVHVDDLQHEQRWSGYVPLAVARGVRAQLAVRLAVEGRTWGAINVYATAGPTIDPAVARFTELFATHAAVAVERSRREENLKAALQTRKLIGQAIGMAMERFQLDEEMAFRYLVRLSSNSNVKLRDIARDLVAEANDRTPSS